MLTSASPAPAVSPGWCVRWHLGAEVAFGDVGSSVNEPAACLVETECGAWPGAFG